jgi:3-deoxy-D-manno-octulosonate 8-phosphate phosphatase (KDO 8-P phosphatase)
MQMKNIKILVMDVDGTLTDGCIYMGPQGEAMKAFNCQDGYAIAQILPKIGITPVIITGRDSQITANRARELKITQLHQGVKDKLPLLQRIAEELGAAREEVAYIGDDLNDMDCLRWCGLTGCPADAAPEVRAVVDFVTGRNGGRGAVREFVDYIRDGE